VVLCQDLPHLSHLGVRARQERVPFATCTNRQVAEALAKLQGQLVDLTVKADRVALTESDGSSSASDTAGAAVGGTGAPDGSAGATKRVRKGRVIPLSKADVQSCGSKAAVCGQLAALATAKPPKGQAAAAAAALFQAPTGAVLPFGCMELAVKDAGSFSLFSKLRDTLDTAVEGAELDAACAEMRELLEGCAPSAALVEELQKELGDRALQAGVIVRSSANVEDLAGLSGAGLYDSVPDVDAADAVKLRAAIVEVWASLFSRRAVLSRRTAGIPQSEACMAVLVQVSGVVLCICYCAFALAPPCTIAAALPCSSTE
jgi:phosphoglucan, water dikinase